MKTILGKDLSLMYNRCTLLTNSIFKSIIKYLGYTLTTAILRASLYYLSQAG